MIGGIKKDQHWMTDYSYVPMVLVAPYALKFKDEKWASKACFAIAGSVLGYSLLTDAKWGAVKLIPYKTHAVLDIAQGLAALTVLAKAPRLAGKAARGTLIAMGVIGIVVGTLSLLGSRKS